MNKALSYIVIALFFWYIYPYKWLNKWKFNHDKKKAINAANNRYSGTPIYVVQYNKRFAVGTRSELRKLDRYFCNRLGLTKDEASLWNYQNAIIYTAK